LLAAALTPFSVPIAPPAVEGTSFTAVVARFTDADQNTDPTQYTARIDWGNGHFSNGNVTTDPAGGFDVKGTFTYATRGSFRVVVHITDKDGDTATAKTTNIVGDAQLTATGVTIQATRGAHLNNVLVANFTDGNPNSRASAFVASVSWGDGRTSVGKVVAKQSGGFRVLGSHTYNTTGTFNIKVFIRNTGPGVHPTQFYTQTNLISDGKVSADHTDPNLINPWGLAIGPATPFWDANNGTGTAELFDGAGNPISFLPLVTIPPPQGSTDTATPTGMVFNDIQANPNSFVVKNGNESGPAIFLFATEDGTISGWNPGVSGNGSNPSTHATLAVDKSASEAIYKGLALLNIPAGTLLPAGQYLFASNFHAGTIDVFDSSFNPVILPAGAFHDPTIPSGYAPFGIQALNGNLYVTYAKQDADKEDDVAGAGHGFVDVYNSAGFFIQRLGGPGVQLELNSPWGVTKAPAGFGKFGNDILVGNFGDSHVSAFDPVTGAFLGQLKNVHGQPIVLTGGLKGRETKGLWGMIFGNGTGAGNPNTLYFASGINDEEDGLFGSLTANSISTATANGTATIVKPSAVTHKVDVAHSTATAVTTASAPAAITTEQHPTSSVVLTPGGMSSSVRIRPTFSMAHPLMFHRLRLMLLHDRLQG
jgi:uncharacterized protein (TIGR03118 family)